MFWRKAVEPFASLSAFAPAYNSPPVHSPPVQTTRLLAALQVEGIQRNLGRSMYMQNTRSSLPNGKASLLYAPDATI